MLRRMLCRWTGCLALLSLTCIAHGATITTNYTGNQTVSVNLADPGGGDILAVRVISGTVQFSGANTYSGGTEIQNGGTFQANTTNALGTGSVLIRTGGMLYGNSGGYITNNISIEDGGNFHAGGNTAGVDGTITAVGGNAQFWSQRNGPYGYAMVPALNPHAGRITGAGSVLFLGGYRGSQADVCGTNDYTGTTVIGTSTWSVVRAFHPNAFGTVVNTISNYNFGADGNGYSYLTITEGCTNGLNPNKSIWCGRRGWVTQAMGTTVSNAITFAGAEGGFGFAGSGSGNRISSGPIILMGGTTSTIYRGGNYGNWYQTGTISGGGALVLEGYNGNDTICYFNGSNTYSGGTTLYNGGAGGRYGTGSRVHLGHDAGFGRGPVTLVRPTSYAGNTHLILDKNLTLANQVAGDGNIDLQTYTLTLAGSLAPGSGTNLVVFNIFGAGAAKLDFRGAYNWKYSETTNDLVAVNALTFGNAGGAGAVNVSWVGTGRPPTPSAAGDYYVLFTYAGGVDPVITTDWTVTTAPRKFRGKVSVDAANKRVLLRLRPLSRTVILVQ